MQQQGFKPDVYLQDPTIYDQNYVEQAGELGNGTYVYTNTALLDDPKQQGDGALPRLARPGQPGADPELLRALRLVGGAAVRPARRRARRQARPRVAGRGAQGCEGWTGNGMHAPQDVGGKRTGQLPVDHPAQRRHVEAGLARAASCATRSSTPDEGGLTHEHLLIAYTILGLFTGRRLRHRGQRAGADLHHHPRVQHRARRLRDGACRSSSGTSASGRACRCWLALLLVLLVVAPLTGCSCSGSSPAGSVTPRSASRWWSRSGCSSG